MTNVIQFPQTRFCLACRDGFHVKCDDKLAMVFGDDIDNRVSCPCGCWDPVALKTRWDAMQDMAARQPRYMATRMWAFQRLNASTVHVCQEGDIRR